MGLCQHSDFFGKPGTSLHSYRILDIAVVDVVLTIVVACVLLVYLPKEILEKIPGKNKFISILAMLFLLGILSHRIFCVRTTVDKLLFPDE
jgi:uncharacterized membrane protein YraQ (UPF0718 family)